MEETFAFDDMRVQEKRRALLDLLYEAAGRVAGCERKRGKARLACLAQQAQMDRTTVQRWFTTSTVPDLESLRKVAEAVELPLLRLLVAQKYVTLDDMAAALGQELPKELPTPDEQSWLSLGRSFSPARRRLYTDFLSRLDADNAGPDRRPEDTSP